MVIEKHTFTFISGAVVTAIVELSVLSSTPPSSIANGPLMLRQPFIYAVKSKWTSSIVHLSLANETDQRSIRHFQLFLLGII